MADVSSIRGETAALPGERWQATDLAGGRLRDLATRAVVSLWFFAQAILFVMDIIVTVRNAGGLGVDPLTAARLVSRACLFFFFTLTAWLTLVRARPIKQASGLQPRVSALLGANLLYLLPFMSGPADLGLSWAVASAALLIVGNIFTLAVLVRLGKSFSVMAEARKLVLGGPYKVIRHPLYLAEQIALTGALIHYASPLAALLFVVQFGFQIQRMCNEEAVLQRSFPDYGAYMARTARLIPGVW